MTAIIGIIMVFSIPLVAILTSYQLKLKKMEMEGPDGGALKELKRQMGYLLNENELQRERIKALEQILSSMPGISAEDRQKLKISIEEKELSYEEIEKLRESDQVKPKNKLF